MSEHETGEPPSEGLRERLKRASEGLEGNEGAQSMESEAPARDPKEEATRLLTEGQTSISEIAMATGLSEQVVNGLRGWLIRSGQLQGKEPQREEPPRRTEVKLKPSPLEELKEEMSGVLQEELMSVPGASEKATAYILKRFASDEELIFDAYRLHALIARFNPRLSDADIVDIVSRVQRVAEAYHLDRLRGGGLGAFQGYRVGQPRPQEYPNYGYGKGGGGLYPDRGMDQSPRMYSEDDMRTQLRFRDMEGRIEKVDDGLRTINNSLEDINKKLETPKTPLDDGSVGKLGEKIEKLEDELKSKDRELDEKDKAHLREELGDLKDEIKGLRSNLGEWRTDEYKLIGEGFTKLTEFGREVLKEAPLSKAAQNVATAMQGSGPPQEVPAEARKTVLEALKGQGLTVPE